MTTSIHPQWDDFGSPTLYLKVLYTDYASWVIAIIELLGEWNDCINNDIMYLKREVVDVLVENGINKVYPDRGKCIEFPRF